MRIEHNKIEDVCRHIAIDADHILDKTVWTRVDRTPEQDQAVTFSLGLWVSAIFDDGVTAYIIEFGGVAGSESPNDNEVDGVIVLNDWEQQVQDVCTQYGLRVRPGKLEQV